MQRFTIKNLEHVSGVKAHTIRIWEKRYAFLTPGRNDSNIRYYTGEALSTFLDVALMNKHGYKISSILKMSAADMQNAIANLNEEESRFENLVNKLVVRMADIDVNGFTGLLDSFIKSRGIEVCINNIIGLVLDKITSLYSEKRFDMLEVFSNIIRQKIIAGIEKQNLLPANRSTVLVFLPEDEHYEIELLYMQYLIRQKGMHVIYLGANVPIKDVGKIASYKQPDFIYTMLNWQAMNIKTEKYLGKMALLFREFKIIITGRQLVRHEKHIPGNMQMVSSVAEAMAYLS